MSEFLLSVVGNKALSCREYLGRTPLHYSALVSEADRDIYEWLVELGAQTDIKDNNDKTPEDYLEEKTSPGNLKACLRELPGPFCFR